MVCGAGASSTFVAQRLRHAAEARGFAFSAFAGTEQSLPIDLDAADVVLVGPHLAHALEQIERDAAARGTAVVLLPDDIFGDLDGTRTLGIVRAAAPASPTPPTPAPTQTATTQTERSTMPAISRTVHIGSSHGLHARPAKLFAQAAKDAGIPVTIAKGSGAPVNAASILGVIALGVEYGDYVTLTADGDGADDVLDQLSELLTTDHDAE
ncbi:hypothetical protein GCM10027411_21320 [Microbacterium aureliae]